MMVPFDLPILTRTLAVQLRLRHTSFEPFVLSQELRLLLDASIDPDSPNVVVGSYLVDWWTDPDTTSWNVLNNDSIVEALEHHRPQRRRSSRRPPVSIPGPATAEVLSNVRTIADSYRTIFETRVNLSARRAAGFLMLSEAAAKKEDEHIIASVGRKMPEFVDFAPPRPAEILHSVSLQVDREAVPPATQDLGIRLTHIEAMELFTPPAGTRLHDRTEYVTIGSIRPGTPPDPQLEDPLAEIFSDISDNSAPSDLDSADEPSHFRQPPLLRVGSHLPPFVYRRSFADTAAKQPDVPDTIASGLLLGTSSPAGAGSMHDNESMDVDLPHANGISVLLCFMMFN